MSNYACSPRCQTKKALKELVEADANSVNISSTSAFGPDAGKSGTFEEIFKDCTKLGVCVIVGPDAYHDRRWYANPARSKKSASGWTIK